MKNIVYATRTNTVLATAHNEALAHTLAETISFITDGTAVYGLCGLQLVSREDLAASEQGREALGKAGLWLETPRG